MLVDDGEALFLCAYDVVLSPAAHDPDARFDSVVPVMSARSWRDSGSAMNVPPSPGLPISSDGRHTG